MKARTVLRDHGVGPGTLWSCGLMGVSPTRVTWLSEGSGDKEDVMITPGFCGPRQAAGTPSFQDWEVAWETSASRDLSAYDKGAQLRMAAWRTWLETNGTADISLTATWHRCSWPGTAPMSERGPEDLRPCGCCVTCAHHVTLTAGRRMRNCEIGNWAYTEFLKKPRSDLVYLEMTRLCSQTLSEIAASEVISYIGENKHFIFAYLNLHIWILWNNTYAISIIYFGT